MVSILVVDDDKNTRKYIEAVLTAENYTVFTAANGEEALVVLDREHVDLVVLDIMMPGMDGYEFTKVLRESNNNLPILMVSARQLPTDKHKGFLAGTDDYMTKPFSPMELVARVKGLFRRIELDRTSSSEPVRITVNDVTFDEGSKSAVCKGQNLPLTALEFNLLLYLARNRNRAVSREELLTRVWGFEAKAETRATDDTVKRVRKKLEEAGSGLRIETIWGYGFRIVTMPGELFP